ncbi:hypothetical protein C7H85_02600 [Zobellella endophytica]|uniref:Cadherin domain-containing protein n=1 Tax=Zobellella endophytica TaxID=2116700 RepID=A0A2P7RBY5_9GAMM|nr:hypothetical protein C7H85_02600 [Zobellella endophytica]
MHLGGPVRPHHRSTDDGDISGGVSYRLKDVGDHALLTIDAATGEVTLVGDPDHEAKSSYDFTVVATDAAGNHSEQAVTLTINDVDESAPTITSGSTAPALDEHSGAGQRIYTASSTDDGDISDGVSYRLKAVDDHALLAIDAATGEVTLVNNPDHEAKSSYSFTVVATDAAGNHSEQAVTLTINDVDESAPTITSGATATTLDENSGSGQVIYTASATDTADTDDTTDTSAGLTYRLKAVGDHALLAIDAATGEVTLVGDPDHEAKSSYDFTVVATDAAGNHSEQAVTLTINDLDESAPTITSGATATAIDENSGAGQRIYTASSTDDGDISGGVSYHLKDVDDHALLAIDAATGAVTLTGDPDFETKDSYDFTVVATDAAGNHSEQAVTLNINDIADEVPPSVSSVAISGAVGGRNDTLNEGDTVSITVTMSENTSVVTTGGTPRIALNIGGSTVYADYVSGSGGTSLVFSYVIEAGQTDANGIGIPENALQLNGGILRDAAGNAANLAHHAVADNAGFLVDTTAPALASSNPVDGAGAMAVDGNIVLTFAETVQAGSGNIVISDGAGDIRTIAVDDAQVSISGNTVTINPTLDLAFETDYHLQIDDGALTDAAGNPYAGIADSSMLNFTTAPDMDTSVVVFDLAEGVSSSHSDRTFQADKSYTVYIRVNGGYGSSPSTDGEGPGLDDSWGTWSGAEHLGADDQIILVGNDAAVTVVNKAVSQLAVNDNSLGWKTQTIQWVPGPGYTTTSFGFPMYHPGAPMPMPVSNQIALHHTGVLQRPGAISVDLWGGAWASNPDQGASLNQAYDHAIPEGVLIDQGLAQMVITSVAITAASGKQGDYLNAGDTLTLTVGLFESVTVDTTGGNPRLALDIGGETVYATYAGGSGTRQLSFTYTVLPGQTDLDGIALPEDALELNGSTLKNVNGVDVILDYGVVTDNAGYKVDTTAPGFTSGATATAINENSGAEQVVYTAQATDDTVLSYSLKADNGDDAAAFTIDAATGAVTLTGNPDFETKASYDFTVVATDAAGNQTEQGVALAINDVAESSTDTSIVVFDLVNGVSSNHSGRVFDANTSYTIYIRMQSDSHILNTDGTSSNPAASWGTWTGSAGTLGTDDKIVFVGDGSPMIGNKGNVVTATGSDSAGGFFLWTGPTSSAFAVFASYAYLSRAVNNERGSATLWSASEGTSHHLWESAQPPKLGLAQHYLTQMPGNILTSQGLV